MFRKKQSVAAAAAQLRGGTQSPFGAGLPAVPPGEAQLYRAMRQSLPVLDAAIGKLVRLSGGFTVRSAQREAALNAFLRTVPCGRGQTGIHSFLSAYLDSLLTYGRAVGEMLVTQGELRAVCWGDVNALEIREGKSPLEVVLCGCGEDGRMRPLPRQELLLFTTFQPEVGHPYGVSLLRSMPFLAGVLLKIYQTLGANWERAGNVRFAVVYKPDGEADPRQVKERSQLLAQRWSEAMGSTRAGSVRDFVAVGDVEIRVIGAECDIPDCQAPVRLLLEQLISQTGIPPFLLGLNWSSTERMSSQQADIMTSELTALRRTLTPVVERICALWLRLHGKDSDVQVEWEEINLQDQVEEARAALYRQQARQLEGEQPTRPSQAPPKTHGEEETHGDSTETDQNPS